MRWQSGIPVGVAALDRSAHGTLLRGVVVATYVTDSEGHPCAEYPTSAAPVAVYCDVLIYGSRGGQRWFGLRNCLVAQPGPSGLHRGRIWKPRAAVVDITGTLSEGSSNPAHLDGDHVLVGFLDNHFEQPVILGSLPHPALDLGREDLESGQRMKLLEADGDPDFFRHHGSHFGIDSNGNCIVDSRFANDGTVTNTGEEPDPPTDGSGSQTSKLPLEAAYDVVFFDMSDKLNPVEKARFTLNKLACTLQIDGQTLTISGADASAVLTLGDGAVKAAIADHLQTFYTQVKGMYAAHKHPSGVGPTGTPDTPFPDWNTAIASQKLTFPDG